MLLFAITTSTYIAAYAKIGTHSRLPKNLPRKFYTTTQKRDALGLPGCYTILGMKSALIAPHTKSAEVSLSTTRATFVLTILAREKDPCEYTSLM